MGCPEVARRSIVELSGLYVSSLLVPSLGLDLNSDIILPGYRIGSMLMHPMVPINKNPL